MALVVECKRGMSTLRASTLLFGLVLVAAPIPFLGGCLDSASMGDDAGDQTPPFSGPGLPDGGTTNSDGATTPSDGGTAPADMAGPVGACAAITCGLHQHCDAALCICDTGFSMQGGVCKASPVGDPATHTQADVCSKYTSSATVVPSFFSMTATTCDPGQLTADGIANAVARINYHRWLSGLAPVTNAQSSDNLAQKCALVSAWNPAGPAAHTPAPAAECYTADGAAGAGSSNIAWGSGTPVGAIDQWIQDNGNSTTMGHRRWILNPPLDPVGFGMYVGGDAGYGSAACLVVFNQSGSGPRPDFVAYPPPGYIPVALAQTTWTFAGDGFNFSAPTVSVTRMSDNANLAVTIIPVQNPGGFNYPDATSWAPSGWTPMAGQIYRVSISAGTKSASYDVKPVGCP